MPCSYNYSDLKEQPSNLNMVQGDGFEPSKLARQIYSLIPLATREPLRMQSLTLHDARQVEKWSWREELNPRPADYKSAALPTELRQPFRNHHLTWSAHTSETFISVQHPNNNFAFFL